MSAVLAEEEWHALRRAHEERVRPWVTPRLERKSKGEKHPVDDFLFEYYSYRPAHILRWHPGVDVILTGESTQEYLTWKGYITANGAVTVDIATLVDQRLDFLQWLRHLLRVTIDRPASFGCFGLHEWAMVYRQEEVRYMDWPLRLSAEEIAEAVEAVGLRCTHYDATRFFTPAATPLNKFQPERATLPQFEQGGCLHANMDLYKWAIKLTPLSSSELVADTFSLARDIRTLDMQASPYDFSKLGYEAVPIETPEGRLTYESRQRAFAERAAALRSRLLALCEKLLTGRVSAEVV